MDDYSGVLNSAATHEQLADGDVHEMDTFFVNLKLGSDLTKGCKYHLPVTLNCDV